MSNDLSHLLTGWGLPSQIISSFQDAGFTLQSLRYVSEKALESLIPLAGPRCLFDAKLAEYLSAGSSRNTNVDSSGDNSANGRSDSGEGAGRSDSGEGAGSCNNGINVGASTSNNSVNVGASTSNSSNNNNSSSAGSSLNRKRTFQQVLDNDSGSSKRKYVLSLEPDEPSVNDLHFRLKNIPEAVPLLAYFNKFQCLDEKHKEELSARVIYGEIKGDFDRRIGRSRNLELAHEIEELFPTESAAYWYSVDVKKGRTVVDGRLFHKFYNTRRYLISVGLLSSTKLQNELDEDEGIDDPSDIEDDDSILWLKVHDTDFTDVTQRWTECSDLRKILRRKLSIYDYIKKFAFLKLKRGWELLSHECERIHPDWRGKVTSDWPLFINFLEDQLKPAVPSKKKKKGSKASVVSSESEGETEETSRQKEAKERQEELRVIKTLSKFAELFRPRFIPKAGNTPKSVPTWKPSRPEVQESFFLHCESGKLQELIDKRRTVLSKYHHTLQPFVAAIGPQGQVPRQYLIIVDKQIYETQSVLEALDTCFKIFFAVDSKYPPECRHLWLIIQRCVYQFEDSEDYTGDKGLKSLTAGVLKSFNTFVESQASL